MRSKGLFWSLLSLRRVAYIAGSSRSSSTEGTPHTPRDKAGREFFHPSLGLYNFKCMLNVFHFIICCFYICSSFLLLSYLPLS